MQSLGVVRKVDDLGRIAIPKELRRTMGIGIGAPMEILIDGDLIILKKYQVTQACIVTGDILNSNVEYAPGIYMSNKGAKIILDQLKKILV